MRGNLTPHPGHLARYFMVWEGYAKGINGSLEEAGEYLLMIWSWSALFCSSSKS
jgi:hypothetical protein